MNILSLTKSRKFILESLEAIEKNKIELFFLPVLKEFSFIDNYKSSVYNRALSYEIELPSGYKLPYVETDNPSSVLYWTFEKDGKIILDLNNFKEIVLNDTIHFKFNHFNTEFTYKKGKITKDNLEPFIVDGKIKSVINRIGNDYVLIFRTIYEFIYFLANNEIKFIKDFNANTMFYLVQLYPKTKLDMIMNSVLNYYFLINNLKMIDYFSKNNKIYISNIAFLTI